MRVAWLLLVWMLVEIALFVTLGGRIGVIATWAEVLASAVGGILVIRRQKRHLFGQALNDLRRLGDVVAPAAHSALIVLAGVLLILPGFLSDAVGLILLIPQVRNFVIEKLHHKVRQKVRMAATDAAVNAMLRPRSRQPDIVEGTAERVSDAPSTPRKPSGWTKP